MSGKLLKEQRRDMPHSGRRKSYAPSQTHHNAAALQYQSCNCTKRKIHGKALVKALAKKKKETEPIGANRRDLVEKIEG